MGNGMFLGWNPWGDVAMRFAATKTSRGRALHTDQDFEDLVPSVARSYCAQCRPHGGSGDLRRSDLRRGARRKRCRRAARALTVSQVPDTRGDDRGGGARAALDALDEVRSNGGGAGRVRGRHSSSTSLSDGVLTRFDEPLALGRIGSHSLECHFCIVRASLRGDDRGEQWLSAEMRAELVAEYIEDLDLPEDRRRARIRCRDGTRAHVR
jgi:hypothetical protein